MNRCVIAAAIVVSLAMTPHSVRPSAARTTHLEGDALAAARAVARDNGFDVDRLVLTPAD